MSAGKPASQRTLLPVHRVVSELGKVVCSSIVDENATAPFTREFYFLSNMWLHVVSDYSGFYGGSDDTATASANTGIRNARVFASCRLDELNIPMATTVQYRGFTVFAAACIPTRSHAEYLQWNTDIPVNTAPPKTQSNPASLFAARVMREVTDNKLYGSEDNGKTFSIPSAELNSTLECAGTCFLGESPLTDACIVN